MRFQRRFKALVSCWQFLIPASATCRLMLVGARMGLWRTDRPVHAATSMAQRELSTPEAIQMTRTHPDQLFAGHEALTRSFVGR